MSNLRAVAVTAERECTESDVPRSLQRTPRSGHGAGWTHNEDAMRRILPASLIALAAIAVAAVKAGPADWPQFLGPDRNGTYTGPLANAWPANGPRIVWRRR